MVMQTLDNTAEANIIGGLALYPNDTDYVFHELIGDDFEDVRLGEIYETIKAMSAKSESIDVALIRNKLPTAEYGVVLAKCAEVFNTMAHYNDYIQTVKIRSQDRRLRKTLENMYVNQNSGTEILTVMRETLQEEESIIDGKKYDKHYTGQYIDYINQKQSIANGEKPKVIRTGLPKLDKWSGGLKQSAVSCIGALPSTGKTDFMLQIGLRNILDGKKVAIFTLEMSNEQLLDRLSAQITDVPYSKISNNNITNDDVKKISIEMSKLYNNKPMIFDNICTIEAIEKTICDVKPDLVLIDYLQIVNTQAKMYQRRFEIENIGNTLKRVSKHVKCHILILSQLVRKKEGLPTMQDLKESGSIEQQCDYIMLMHRPYVLDKGARDSEGNSISPKQTFLILDKNKYGQCGKMELVFNGEKQLFCETTENFEV